MNNKEIKVENWIDGKIVKSKSNNWIDKFNPHSGEVICKVSCSSLDDVNDAVFAATNAFDLWSETTPVTRGNILFKMVNIMKENSEELANNIALETGKPFKDAIGEVGGAIMQGEFFAGEGMRLYGKTLTSGMPGKMSQTIRLPHGVVGLIVPANTPIANIAWKIFPALICGNTIVLKSSEDSPSIANMIAKISKEAELPDGVLNIIQGDGASGAALVENENISLISFTGSTVVGKLIAQNAGKRLARVSLELGGKNSFVVCEDADIDHAVHWAALSVFSNAGQRCAATSRILVFESIYKDFINKLVDKANSLKLGVSDNCDLGPVVNKRQYQNIIKAINEAKDRGGTILCGGNCNDKSLRDGYYISPTLISNLPVDDDLNETEIFGPVATIQTVKNLEEALKIANNSKYGLTAAIHTQNINRALWYSKRVNTGLVNVNIGTYGSEPHMPFGGYGLSGNGTREPGVEALDVYSELKNISFLEMKEKI
ncbi:aldehyde dehydrogenase family protein [Gammaproteobacteria bacterium]|nr:aldehyde dehydrogenase family protein [Gammaproteobacteria bacterium]